MTRLGWGPRRRVPAFCRWGGAAVGDAPSPRRSRGGSDTWSGSSNDRGLGPATRRRLPPAVGRRTEVRATDRGRPDARKRPAPWRDEGADETTREGAGLSRSGDGSWRATGPAPRRPRRSARRRAAGPPRRPSGRLVAGHRQALVVALQLGMFGRQRVGLGDLGAALDRL